MLTTSHRFAWPCFLGVALGLCIQPAFAQPSDIEQFFAKCYGDIPPPVVGAPATRRADLDRHSLWECLPPYELPPYVKPADDGVAFDALIEAAGHTPTRNGNWLGVAAGNFCGNDEKQMLLAQNRSPNFSLLHGPAPHRPPNGGSANLESSASHSWRAVVAANLDGGPKDHFVAVRKIATAGESDLVVGNVTTCSCDLFDILQGWCERPQRIASATIGTPSNSDWIGVAVGNFDRSGKQIALLRNKHSNLVLVKMTQQNGQSTLNVTHLSDLDFLGGPKAKWRAIAAGDIDGDGVDELIVAREVSNGSATVFALKWDATIQRFRHVASSTFGSTGNSNWTGATVGDFNADGRQAIVLVKNKHSNFVVLDLPADALQLRIVATSDLDSSGGQKWTGLASADWSHGDESASELIAVRAAKDGYRTSVFVYGNAWHRALRNSALADTKAQWDTSFGRPSTDDLKSWMRLTHTNTYIWHMQAPGDYARFVEFLDATKDWGVDGRQFRVWVTIIVPRYVVTGTAPGWDCSQPEATPFTTWNALDYFSQYLRHTPPTDDEMIAACKDVYAWAHVIGRLATQFPHLVGFSFDDFSEQFDRPFKPEHVAAIESTLRSQAPWLFFAPYMYYPLVRDDGWKDIGVTLDSMVFFFRNEKYTRCISFAPECDRTRWYAPQEIADMTRVLPAGRKMLLGSYWKPLMAQNAIHQNQFPTTRYDYDLARLALSLPAVGSSVAYGVQRPRIATCSDSNFLDDSSCTLRQAYGGKPQFVTHKDLTPSGASAYGNPAAYFAAIDGNQHAIYRTGDGRLHELWWSSGPAGHVELNSNGPPTAGDPAAYFEPTLGTQHVIYRGQDTRLHELSWTTGAVGHRVLTPFGPPVIGDPAAKYVAADTMHQAVYRSTHGVLQEVRWSTSSIAQRTLNPSGPFALSDASLYFMPSDGTHHAIVRGGSHSHVHELVWTSGVPGRNDLTALSGSPVADGDPASYFITPDGAQHVIYRDVDGHLHELFWTVGTVGHADLTAITNAPPAESNPAAYFAPASGTQHVVYRSPDGHLHELWWTTSIVTWNDLTALASAPKIALGDPFAYVAPDGSHHVVYRSNDLHIRELRWRK